MSCEGVKEKADLDVDLEQMQDDLFEAFLNTEDVTQKKFANLLKHVQYLGIALDDKDNLIKLKDIIVDKYKVQNHDNIIRLLKSEEYIVAKLANLAMNGMDAKNMTNPYHKVKLVKVMETKYGIDFAKEVGANSGEMEDDLYNLIKHTFNLRKVKPTTIDGINTLYASMIRSITKDKTLVRANKKGINMSKDAFARHIELNAIKHKNQYGFSNSTIEVFDITLPPTPDLSFDELDEML